MKGHILGYLNEIDWMIRTRHGIQRDKQIPHRIAKLYIPNLTRQMTEVGSTFTHQRELYVNKSTLVITKEK